MEIDSGSHDEFSRSRGEGGNNNCVNSPHGGKGRCKKVLRGRGRSEDLEERMEIGIKVIDDRKVPDDVVADSDNLSQKINVYLTYQICHPGCRTYE